MDIGLPLIAVRLAEGRCGSTLLMQLLATADEIVFDDRYPSEYRFLSYFARMSTMMTEPFDHTRHVGLTPFFFDQEQSWGPIPFSSEVVDIAGLSSPLLAGMWDACSRSLREKHPDASFYAEKIAVDVTQFVNAGISVRVIDLVRDPRDVLASIRAFTASGIDGFGRTPGMDEAFYVEKFIATFRAGLRRMLEPLPSGVDRLTLRYEDLVENLEVTTAVISSWLRLELKPSVLEQQQAHRSHRTSASAASSVGRWRRDLSLGEADLIATELRDQAARFGYHF